MRSRDLSGEETEGEWERKRETGKRKELLSGAAREMKFTQHNIKKKNKIKKIVHKSVCRFGFRLIREICGTNVLGLDHEQEKVDRYKSLKGAIEQPV